MLAVKNSTNRRDARSPAAAITTGKFRPDGITGTISAVCFWSNITSFMLPQSRSPSTPFLKLWALTCAVLCALFCTVWNVHILDRANDQAFARRFHNRGADAVQPVDLQHTGNLRQQAVEQAEVAAGDPQDGGQALFIVNHAA